MSDERRPRPDNVTAFPGTTVDRDAARRAALSVNAVRTVLPPPSVTVLAREVIARLAAQVDRPDDAGNGAQELADALWSRDDRAAMRMVMRRLTSGEDVETVYLVHLAGAARILGTQWTRDALTSAQVTIAAARIYAIMRSISSNLVPERWPDGRHAIFAVTPGERHTLGVSMAADLFRRDGWLIELKVGRNHDELIEELANSDYGILGLSATDPRSLPSLIRLTAAVRVSSPHVQILISGRLAKNEPRLKELTDVDAVSDEFDTARAVMKSFHDKIAARTGAARG